MKIVVSYLSSIYDTKKTIGFINTTDADAIHADLMDGEYVATKNFAVTDLDNLYSDNKKPIEFHLMVNNPSKYFTYLSKFSPTSIFIHPASESNPKGALNELKSHNIIPGIVINPDEDINSFQEYFPNAGKVILMSVYPGKGGQEFIKDTTSRLKTLIEYKNKYGFQIEIDGGITDKTIKLVDGADIVVSGSYICKSTDYQKQIDSLKY